MVKNTRSEALKEVTYEDPIISINYQDKTIEVITIQSAMQLLGVSRQRIYQFEKAKRIVFRKFQKHSFVDLMSLKWFIMERGTPMFAVLRTSHASGRGPAPRHASGKGPRHGDVS